jgi:hypothetical protein
MEKENITILKSRSSVLFDVDATESRSRLKHEKFSIIMFTFTHTGTPNSSPSSIENNKKLIVKSLMLAQHVLTDNDEIQIILKTSAPYDSWSFPKFFADEKFQIEERSHRTLDASIFPGHVHRLTKGEVHGLNSVQSGNARFIH